MLTTYLTVALVAYLLGSVPFGYILVKLFLKQDVRQTGSGNIGATNVARAGKKGLAIATLLLDAGKGAVAVIACFWLFSWAAIHSGVTPGSLAGTAALSAIMGHVFPIWLGFKGGKGVATALGAFLLIVPQAVLAAFVVFAIVFVITRYVSLASICAALVFPLLAHLLPRNVFGEESRSFGLLVCLIASCALVILKHHSNIRRLVNGTEPKFGSAKQTVSANPIQAEKNA